MQVVALALTVLILGIPHPEDSATLSLAPKTNETPAQQQQAQQQPAQQQADGDVDEGHHPLKKMQKRVLAQEKARKFEKAQGKLRKVEEARESKAGHHKKKLKKKVKAMEKMKHARTRREEAAGAREADSSRGTKHALDVTPPVERRKMITLSRGRAGSSVVAATIAAFSLANAKEKNPNDLDFHYIQDFGKEIFGGSGMAMEQMSKPVPVMSEWYQKQAAEQPFAPLGGFKWKPEVFNSIYDGAWDWVVANNVSVIWLTRNLLDVRMSVAKHNRGYMLRCKPGADACAAKQNNVKLTLGELSYLDSSWRKAIPGNEKLSLVECLTQDKDFYETQLMALLEEKGVKYRHVAFDEMFEITRSASSQGYFMKLLHDNKDAHKAWNGMFSFLGLPTVATYGEIVETADAQMESTTPTTQCDNLADADAVRDALKGSEFEGLLRKC
jgi:hypothetical protein